MGKLAGNPRTRNGEERVCVNANCYCSLMCMCKCRVYVGVYVSGRDIAYRRESGTQRESIEKLKVPNALPQIELGHM